MLFNVRPDHKSDKFSFSTSIVGHHNHRRAGPRSLRIDDLEGDQVLGVGRQLGDYVSETGAR